MPSKLIVGNPKKAIWVLPVATSALNVSSTLSCSSILLTLKYQGITAWAPLNCQV